MMPPGATWGLICGLLAVLISQAPVGASAADEDPWRRLQAQFQSSAAVLSSAPSMVDDPWTRLRETFLSFSQRDDQRALLDSSAGQRVFSGLHEALRPYRALIGEASRRFDIPEAIIGAVIMVESGGRARAKAATSSASGLMQTIDATFSLARRRLVERGIHITNDPFDPQASIMAGCWYLDRMFCQAQRDGVLSEKRSSLAAWRRALEYYYAGPGNGRKAEKVVVVYAGGRRVSIDKPAYSRKVLHWAQILTKR